MLDLERLYAERVVYSVPDMDRGGVREDLVYRTLEDQELKLDVYYPRDYVLGEKRPAVVLVHGEWPPHIIRHSKDLGVYITWAQLIVSTGVIAVNFNHRATERLTKVRDAASDVANLIAYLRYNADDLGIDETRLCVWAFSAGMPLGMWAALKDDPDYVRCIVAYYGVMDLQQSRDLLPDDVSSDTLRDFSALYYLQKYADKIAPTFIAKAGLDNAHLNSTIDSFVAEAQRVGARVEMMLHSEGHHGFDVLDDNDRSRDIIRRTLAFVRDTLNG
ncbi:MAG: alpha/beta hydrolase [Chloroflexota bacterium]